MALYYFGINASIISMTRKKNNVYTLDVAFSVATFNPIRGIFIARRRGSTRISLLSLYVSNLTDSDFHAIIIESIEEFAHSIHYSFTNEIMRRTTKVYRGLVNNGEILLYQVICNTPLNKQAVPCTTWTYYVEPIDMDKPVQSVKELIEIPSILLSSSYFNKYYKYKEVFK
jgi:hypothetical protein